MGPAGEIEHWSPPDAVFIMVIAEKELVFLGMFTLILVSTLVAQSRSSATRTVGFVNDQTVDVRENIVRLLSGSVWRTSGLSLRGLDLS